jgi:hypothetical protein
MNAIKNMVKIIINIIKEGERLEKYKRKKETIYTVMTKK